MATSLHSNEIPSNMPMAGHVPKLKLSASLISNVSGDTVRYSFVTIASRQYLIGLVH